MSTSSDNFDSRLLVMSDQISRKAWEQSLKDALGTGVLQQNVRAMLADVFLRGLMEVHENGATNIENALKLKAMNFITSREMTVPSSNLKGNRLQYVSLTPEGLDWIDYWRGAASFTQEDVSAFDIFLRIIRSYLVVDNGNGIVVTKGVAQVAIALQDNNLLSHLVQLGHNLLQFNLDLDDKAIEETHWMERASEWSGCCKSKRSGATLVDLYEHW